MRTVVWLAVSLLSVSCVEDVEGDEANECRDGADNDQDGYFDCQDNGCWSSPDCDGVPHDTGDTGDTGIDDTGDPGPDWAAVLKTASVDMALDFDFDDAFCNEVFNLCDCGVTYAGSGDQVEAEGGRVTMQGTWTLGSTDCAGGLETSIWFDDAGAGAYLSFVVDEPVETLARFVAHRRLADHEPFAEGARDKGQYWIDEMGDAISGGVTVHHVEVQNDKIDGLIDLALTTTVDVTFTR